MDRYAWFKLGYNIVFALSWAAAGLGGAMLNGWSQENGAVLFIGGLAIGAALLFADTLRNYMQSKPLKLSLAIKESKVVWGFWQAGGVAKMKNVLKENKPSSLKKLLLLKPDIHEPSFQFITSLAGRGDPDGISEQIAEINTMRKLARSTGSEVLFHTEPLAYTFTIFDKKPDMTDKGNPLPNSKHAWIVVQPLEPMRGRDPEKWHKWIIRNKGETEGQFVAYLEYFQRVEKGIRDKG
ncbi:MAG: hypothetical protein ABSB31_03790 [Dehalococcoidia bacterium]|jgi:hypothetical protein